jgi:hypothetical protein
MTPVAGIAMAADYRARAAELLAQSRLEPDEDAAAMLEDIATCFQQLADTPALPIVFEFPRKPVAPHYPSEAEPDLLTLGH